MSDNLKRFKKGEYLFKEGDPNTHIYVIQSGKVAIVNDRTGRKVEITVLGANQIIGEQGLFGAGRHLFTAEAMQETRVMEVAIDLMKTQVNNCPPGVKLLLKSLVDDAKSMRTTLRSMKMDQDKAPCPQVSIPRVFSLLNLVARHVGKRDEKTGEIKVSWSILKLYASRMFSESFQRMRGILDILTKLQYAELIMSKNDDGDVELSDTVLKNVQLLEDFAEFYQYNYYKGGRAEVIYPDPLALKVAKGLVASAKGAEPDRKGIVDLEYNKVLEELKTNHKVELKPTHMDLLEKKGLFVKRKSRDDGSLHLLFDKAEFEKIATFWALIHEIDKWNEKGQVLMKDDEPKADAGGAACPSCKGALAGTPKFCPHCGHKLVAAA